MVLFSYLQKMAEAKSEKIELYDDRKRRKYLTHAEFDSFMESAYRVEAHKRSLILVIANTGCLLNEALALTAHDIDLSGQSIFFANRDGHERSVPIPPEVIKALDVIHAISVTQKSKSSPNSSRLWPVDRTTAWRWITQAMKAAGLRGPQAGPRGIRYFFILRKLHEGFPIEAVQHWLGSRVDLNEAVFRKALAEAGFDPEIIPEQ